MSWGGWPQRIWRERTDSASVCAGGRAPLVEPQIRARRTRTGTGTEQRRATPGSRRTLDTSLAAPDAGGIQVGRLEGDTPSPGGGTHSGAGGARGLRAPRAPRGGFRVLRAWPEKEVGAAAAAPATAAARAQPRHPPGPARLRRQRRGTPSLPRRAAPSTPMGPPRPPLCAAAALLWGVLLRLVRVHALPH